MAEPLLTCPQCTVRFSPSWNQIKSSVRYSEMLKAKWESLLGTSSSSSPSLWCLRVADQFSFVAGLVGKGLLLLPGSVVPWPLVIAPAAGWKGQGGFTALCAQPNCLQQMLKGKKPSALQCCMTSSVSVPALPPLTAMNSQRCFLLLHPEQCSHPVSAEQATRGESAFPSWHV